MIVYQHYKTVKPGQTISEIPTIDLYELLTEGVLEATLCPMVAYRNLGTGKVWFRRRDSFFEYVEVAGGLVPRFQAHQVADRSIVDISVDAYAWGLTHHTV